MAVVGKDEAARGTVNLRNREIKDPLGEYSID